MANRLYFVQCGNWCLQVSANPKDYDTVDFLYSELATKSLEIIFGTRMPDAGDDYYAIMNVSGENVLNKEGEDYPIPTFTTKIHVLSSKKNQADKLLTSLRTSDMFANAGQYHKSSFDLYYFFGDMVTSVFKPEYSVDGGRTWHRCGVWY